MNTAQLKSFASEARISLLSGVKSKMNALGFKANGEVDERDFPIKAPDGTLFQNEIYDVAFYGKWMRLHEEIKRCGFRQVCEEGAYTWFNRLMAIRILAKNEIINPVLEFESPEIRIPIIVKHAHDGIRPDMPAFDTMRLDAIIDDDNRITDQFAILIVAYCQTTPILYKCFGMLNDFTELLLPTNILASNGFLNLLNSSSFITDEDFKTTELIGWLYQFYISDRKDEVFASFKKGKKAEANDIPAATQIFTPNWIVKYMVQNTLGRIYLDNNPASTLAEQWKYLVPPVCTNTDSTLKLENLEDYTFTDLSCGSGHILNEAFDILFEIYKEEGYNRRQAIKSIFEHNLLGIDLDTRARQLSTFSLMLKACQQLPVAINCEVMPRVLDMTGLTPPNYNILDDTLSHFFLGCTAKTKAETMAAINLMQQANNLGSIMKFDISPETRAAIAESMKRWEDEGLEDFEGLFPAMKLILALTDNYAAIVMNPPYMGNGNMNANLYRYVETNYENGKTDLFAVFMMLAMDRLKPLGKYGMINMHSWMFLSSFEKLRKNIIQNNQIDNMLHLGARTFDEISGEVVQNTSFVISNHKPFKPSTFYRLIDGKSSSKKEELFFSNEPKIVYPKVDQSIFLKIPSYSIDYWVSSKMLDTFSLPKMSSVSKGTTGNNTGDNNRFLKQWSEVSIKQINFNMKPGDSFDNNYKWVPCNKGGGFRRWYGNNDFVMNWYDDGKEMKEYAVIRNHGKHWSRYIQNLDSFYKEGATWNMIAIGKFSLRYCPGGFINASASNGTYPPKHLLNYIIALSNSSYVQEVLNLINPTINVSPGAFNSIPYIEAPNFDEISRLSQKNIQISKLDWDAHETSWDFQENELVRLFKEGKATNLESSVKAFEEEWEQKFHQLHQNEEELNRQFIEIYGLQDELSPEVPQNEITILQQGEISFTLAPGSDNYEYSIDWHRDVIIKQFLSYAIGCIMGRYRLDKPGLNIAHPNPTEEELAPYRIGDNAQLFEIDDDAIIPLMSPESGFADCASTRVSQFIKMVFGEKNHAANMNFVQKALEKDLDTFFAKDFYADHKKRYQNRPIYWLFSSPKGAFQVLVYMHRMTPYTVERIRSKYLLPYIERLTERINDMNASILQLTSVQARALQKMEKDLQECREYHDMLHPVANQNISIDLDDGVVVNYAKFGSILAKLK
ncbi:MAG: BREX-1 system adenine-specific DNA-methyltransferase PglX [Bacteroidales bacterium]|nr:BREX-1 system adenine-specific DNA-methyltransferase PglX [Bacteroidales bacterium]